MRKYIILDSAINGIRKLMLHSYDDEGENYVYVYLYDIEKDVPCTNDLCFESLDDAIEYCNTEYSVRADALWVDIDDPMEYCQHDIIAPVRIQGRKENQGWYGRYEKLVEGRWEIFDIDKERLS